MDLERFHCPNCGSGEFGRTDDGAYRCAYCGGRFSDIAVQRSVDDIRIACGDTLNAILLEKREEEIAFVRSNLYGAVHAEFLDIEKITELCRELKRLMPNDFQAEFFEVASGNNISAINEFVSKMDVDNEGVVDYVLEYLIKLINSGTLLVIDDLIRRAYEKKDISKYNVWQEKYQKEAQKIETSVYDVTYTRDVFIAYKSEDMARVMALVDYLEMQEGFSCFVAARNLQHGRAVDYDQKIKQALDNCRAVVFVSSRNARKTGDAREKELPYIRAQDFDNGPKEWKARSDYKGLPKKYKKPRVEYVVEEYINLAAEKPIAEFFDGYERCYNIRAVAESLVEQFQTAAAESVRSEKAIAEADEIKQQQQQLEAKLKRLEKATASGEATVGSMLIRAENALFRDNNTAKSLFNEVLNCDVENCRAWWGLLKLEFNIRVVDDFIRSMNYLSYVDLKKSVNFGNVVKYAHDEEECMEFVRKVKGRIEEFAPDFEEKSERRKNELVIQKARLKNLKQNVEVARENASKGSSAKPHKIIIAAPVVASIIFTVILYRFSSIFAVMRIIAPIVGVIALVASTAFTVINLNKRSKAYSIWKDNADIIDQTAPEIERLESNIANINADISLINDILKDCDSYLRSVAEKAILVSGNKADNLMGGSEYIKLKCAVHIVELKCKDGDYVSENTPTLAVAAEDSPIAIKSPIKGSVLLNGSIKSENCPIFVKKGVEIGSYTTQSEVKITEDIKFNTNDKVPIVAPADMLIFSRNKKFEYDYGYANVDRDEALYEGLEVEPVIAQGSGFIKYHAAVGDVLQENDIMYVLE